MAKIDRIKEEIGWLKLVFGALVAIDASLMGWVAQNYAIADRLPVLAGVLASGIVSLAIVWVTGLMYRQLAQLEDV
jgi:hypothetical protein